MNDATVIILARAGSKGVPGKNTAPVADRPCIAWTIDAALDAQRAGAVGRIVVSTDDAGAMLIARAMSVEVVVRPTELASDAARVDDAARHAMRSIDGIEVNELTKFHPIVILYANVPARPRGLIERATALMRRTHCHSVQSYSPVGKHHPWWTARVDAAGAVAAWEGDVLNHGLYRRQQLPPAFIPDGGVLVVCRAALMLDVPGAQAGPHAFFGTDRRGVVNGEGEVVDIDSPIDLVVADAVLRARRTQELRAA